MGFFSGTQRYIHSSTVAEIGLLGVSRNSPFSKNLTVNHALALWRDGFTSLTVELSFAVVVINNTLANVHGMNCIEYRDYS